MATREEDYVETVFTASTHDYILFFTNCGRVYRKKGYQIPEAGRAARGTNIVNILPDRAGREGHRHAPRARDSATTCTSSWSPAAAPSSACRWPP